MAELITECEWKRDVTGICEKMVRHGELLLTSLLMEAGYVEDFVIEERLKMA